jgi:hypothetical protein
MNFEERNAAWDGTHVRMFAQPHSRSSTPRVWSVWVERNITFYEWGQWGGALQRASDISQGVNLGKKNEMSPAAYALDRAKEMCRKKNWEGYREVRGQPYAPGAVPEYIDPPAAKVIDFEDLPLSLSFYKPDNTMGAGMAKKAEAGKVLYARKRNGLMYVLARGEGERRPKLYSRRMLRQHDDEVGTPLTWDDRFPHIIRAAERVMPPNSILLGELIMDATGWMTSRPSRATPRASPTRASTTRQPRASPASTSGTSPSGAVWTWCRRPL